MTIELFIFLFTIGALLSSLLTEAIKKAIPNSSSNLLALCSAVLVGVIGMTFYYITNGIIFSISNLIYIILMAVCIWIGSMIGYDKVIQTIAQIRR